MPRREREEKLQRKEREREEKIQGRETGEDTKGRREKLLNIEKRGTSRENS